jgi:uncharacterized metal-binding protein YceD (DUF177 family)
MEAWRMNKPEGWRVPVHLESIPDSGTHLELDADDEVRSKLAAAAGLLGVTRLHASVDLTRHGDGLRASGQVRATIGQTCVVSLEPLENTVDEAFDVLFLPPELVVDPSAVTGPVVEAVDDTRETLVDGIADIGAVAAEFFLLGIDPYPRKPGAVFAAPVEDRAADSPFAALAKLKPPADKS